MSGGPRVDRRAFLASVAAVGGSLALGFDIPFGRRAARVVMTVVRFRRLHESEIAAYLACGEWRGKAGGYAIQGRAEAFIPAINGSYSNVVGLPLAATLDLLRGLGWRPQR